MTGRVSVWHTQEGWGVLESDQTPGGCWVHYSAVETTGVKELHPAHEVDFDWEPAEQDGYRFRAISVRPQGQPSDAPPAPSTSETAPYRSSLVIDWDQPPNT